MDLEALQLALDEARLTGDDAPVQEALRHSGWRPTHRAIPITQEEILARIKVDPVTGCWVWKLKLTKGYGEFRGRAAHRAAWEAFIGPIPEGLHLDHVCRNRACVQPHPDHLEPVTKSINNERAMAVVQQYPGERVHNFAKRWCVNGHRFTAETTGVDGMGKRFCKVCRHDSLKRWRARQKAKGRN